MNEPDREFSDAVSTEYACHLKDHLLPADYSGEARWTLEDPDTFHPTGSGFPHSAALVDTMKDTEGENQ